MAPQTRHPSEIRFQVSAKMFTGGVSTSSSMPKLASQGRLLQFWFGFEKCSLAWLLLLQYSHRLCGLKQSRGQSSELQSTACWYIDIVESDWQFHMIESLVRCQQRMELQSLH
jgi:hypothetical protein